MVCVQLKCKLVLQLDSLHCFSQSRSPSCPMVHFRGVHPRGYDPQIQIQARLCTMHLPTKFHHPTCTRSNVIVITHKQANKQTLLKTCNAVHYICCQKLRMYRQRCKNNKNNSAEVSTVM